MDLNKIIKRFRIDKADKFRLTDIDPADTCGLSLDKDEAKAMPRVAKNFDAIDADKDGTVSLEEIHAFMKAQHKGAGK